MEKKKITSENGSVYYWIEKNKNKKAKTIVFTHGLTATHLMFEKQIPFFSKDFTVITWDVPLHGESQPYTNFSYENTAKELHSILENENIEQVILVGMSMGGYPSQMFANLYPKKVLAFVALDTTPFGLSYYSKSDIFWLKKAASIMKVFPLSYLKKSIAKTNSTSPYAYEQMLVMLEPFSKKQICEQIQLAYAGFIEENKDIHFDFPVLILVGENDKTGKVKEYSQTWAKKENYPLKIISRAAHMSNMDNPEEVNQYILNFI